MCMRAKPNQNLGMASGSIGRPGWESTSLDPNNPHPMWVYLTRSNQTPVEIWLKVNSYQAFTLCLVLAVGKRRIKGQKFKHQTIHIGLDTRVNSNPTYLNGLCGRTWLFLLWVWFIWPMTGLYGMQVGLCGLDMDLVIFCHSYACQANKVY